MTLSEPTAAVPVARTVLSVELADRVRRMIMEGELAPGEKVPERHLTELFGVSRTPLREAIKVLAHEGLVHLVPNRGSIIAEQSLDELAEVFPVVAALEGLAGELAAGLASAAEIAAVETETRRLRRAYEKRDRPAYFEANNAIHAAIIAAARNPTLARNHASLSRRIARARYQANLSEERWKAATEEHEAIATAFGARDGAALGAAMRRHLMNKLGSIAGAPAGKPPA